VIRQLVLVAPGHTGCQRFELNRSMLLRFWRTRHTLAAYAPGTAP
jgi:hypothetical protein